MNYGAHCTHYDSWVQADVCCLCDKEVHHDDFSNCKENPR